MELKIINGGHFYEAEGKLYPSVTTILNAYPKGQAFRKWLKQNGMMADMIRDKAAERGTKVHKALELLLNGDKLSKENYSKKEWEMINRFIEFVNSKESFKALKTEFKVLNKEIGYAGTVDLLCEINGKKWLIDFKTSKNDRDSHHLQSAAYTLACEDKVDRSGVLVLGMRTNIGWKLAETTDITEKMGIFMNVKAIWDYKNPKTTLKKTDKKLPSKLKLEAKKTIGGR